MMQQYRLLRSTWPVVATLVAIVGVAAGEIVVSLVGVAVLVAGGLARLAGWTVFVGLEVQHSLTQTHAFVGETIEYHVKITNRKVVPVPWLEVRSEVPEMLVPTNRALETSGIQKIALLKRTSGVRWYERVTWRYPIPLTTRGYFSFGSTRLRAGDLFGFFTGEQVQSGVISLWVYPEVVPLAELGLESVRPFGERRGIVPYAEDPTRLHGLRDYRAGDPLKRVDWKATARRRALQSRIYDPASQPQIMLALNVATMPHVSQGYVPEVFEQAVSVAASLAAAFSDARAPIGLIANCTYPGRNANLRVPPGRATGQLTRIFEALAMADLFAVSPIEQLLANEARQLPAGSTVVLVTALLSPPVEAALLRLSRRGHRAAVVYIGVDAPTPIAGVPLHDIRHALADLKFRPSVGGHTWTRVRSDAVPPDPASPDPASPDIWAASEQPEFSRPASEPSLSAPPQAETAPGASRERA